MTPAARVQAAIDILDIWRAGDAGLDRILARWGRENRYAGSGDRRAIADLCYDTLRRKRSAAWVAGAGEDAAGRDLLRGTLMLSGTDLDAVFTGVHHAPAALTELERGGRPLEDAPAAVQRDLPDWLLEMFAGYPDEVALALRERAPVDLRVNLLKADRASAEAALAQDGIAVVSAPLSDTALRVGEGARKVARSAAYDDGLVEIQDAASQAVIDMITPVPGETVLDLCAGAGGKTLAMAARMGGTGQFLAHDIAPDRMTELAPRSARAGVSAETIATDELQSLAGRVDLVLVDAPCSGSGAWRRNPDAKWRLTPEGLQRLVQTQDAVLDQAAALAAPDGRIAYMTCSLLPVENDARIAAFQSRRHNWSVLQKRQITPLDGGDGFFCVILTRINQG